MQAYMSPASQVRVHVAGVTQRWLVMNPVHSGPELACDSRATLSRNDILCMACDVQGNEPVPYDALLNFKGQGNLSATDKTEVSSYSLIKGVAATCTGPLTKMGRLRIINSGGFAVFKFSVDNHRLDGLCA